MGPCHRSHALAIIFLELANRGCPHDLLRSVSLLFTLK